VSSSEISVWGEAVPNWIAAIGGLGGTVVAVVAFVQSIQNRGGLETVRRQENLRENAGPEPDTRLLATLDADADYVAPDTGRRVKWKVVQVHRDRYALRNSHDEQVATVLGLRGTGRSESDIVPLPEMPAQIEPAADLPFLLARSLASPAVASVEVEWTEDGAGPFTATYLV
jgi:hypothetical protein